MCAACVGKALVAPVSPVATVARMLLLYAVLAAGCTDAAFAATGSSRMRVQLLLSEWSGPYLEAAQVIRSRLADKADVVMSLDRAQDDSWGQTLGPGDLLVPLGAKAARTVAEKKLSVPVLAALLPRRAYEAIQKEVGTTYPGGRFSVIYLDQPWDRQMALIRLMLPEVRRMGVLLSESNIELRPALSESARDQGFQMETAIVDGKDQLFVAQRGLLRQVEVMLALPDPQVINRETLESYLITAYRAHVPVFGFSKSLSESGALAAIFTTPEQIGEQAVEIIRDVIEKKAYRPGTALYPRYFRVHVNRHVARSLQIPVPEERWLLDQISRYDGSRP